MRIDGSKRPATAARNSDWGRERLQHRVCRTTVPAYRKMWTEEIKAKPLESVKLADMVVRVRPAADTAIASYQIEIRTHQPGGKLTDEKFFETDVWVHKGDAWRLRHVYFSAIPAK